MPPTLTRSPSRLDRDLVGLVHHARLRRARRVGDDHGERVALDRIDRHPDADRLEQQGRVAADRHEVGIPADGAAVGDDPAHPVAREHDPLDRRAGHAVRQARHADRPAVDHDGIATAQGAGDQVADADEIADERVLGLR